MATRKLVSKEIGISADEYIGQVGDIWVDDEIPALPLGDGVTPRWTSCY